MKKAAYIIALMAVAIFAISVYDARSPDPEAQEKLKSVLNAELPDLDGRREALSQWRGKLLVVNFWASWCPPCRAEMPGFVALQNKYRDRGVAFVGIALDSPEKAAAYARSIGVNYPILVDEDSTVLSPSGLPFTIVFDRRGIPVDVRKGLFPEADLDAIVAKLL